jgi:hypothetical protein
MASIVNAGVLRCESCSGGAALAQRETDGRSEVGLEPIREGYASENSENVTSRVCSWYLGGKSRAAGVGYTGDGKFTWILLLGGTHGWFPQVRSCPGIA